MQTDWGLASIRLRVGTDPSNLGDAITVPITELSGALGLASSAEVKLYGAYLPIELPNGETAPRGISSAAPLFS